MDRKKDLIIRGGYNVYPREIEEVLYEHPAVAEAAVIGLPHPSLGEEVAAAVVLKPGADISPEELRDYVKRQVAAYKYPRHVWIADASKGADRKGSEAGYRRPARPDRAVRLLLLLAPPGAGKGTQGERLAAWSGARHLAAGDLLRAEASAGSPLGREIATYQARGDLVPDRVVLDVLTPAVVEAAARAGTSLTASRGPFREAVLTRRLLDRAGPGGRTDDRSEVIRHRLEVYAKATAPLVAYYTERAILVAVDADQSPDSVTAAIQAGLSGLSLTGPRSQGT